MYEAITKAATQVILEVMEAGGRQREAAGKSTEEWKNEDTTERLNHAFMHLVRCKTHEGTHGNPWGLTDNTHLEEWKHALTGLAIVAAHQSGLVNPAELVIDTTQDEVAGE